MAAERNEARESMGASLPCPPIPKPPVPPEDQMFIRIRVGVHTYGLSSYREMVKKLAGKLVEVETDFLFVDQYNTVPVKGVSASGLRVMQIDVEEVIQDQRPDAGRCEGCHRILLHAVSRRLVGSLCRICGHQYGYMKDGHGRRLKGIVVVPGVVKTPHLVGPYGSTRRSDQENWSEDERRVFAGGSPVER